MGESTGQSPFEVIKSLHPELHALSDDQIRGKAAQFAYKRIIEFLSSELNKTGYQSETAFLPRILPYYSDLSSFVHGGPMAMRGMVGLDKEEKLFPQLEEMADLTVSISAASKLFALIMLANVDNRFARPAAGFRRLMNDLKMSIGANFEGKANQG